MRSGNSLYLISSIIAYALYCVAPDRIDESFQIVCFLLFAVQSIFVLKDDIRREGWMNFNIIFLFSFFFVTYAFPLFVLSSTLINPEGIEAFIDFSVSCKCSALCTFAISIYFWAYKKKRRKIFDFSSIIRLNGSNFIYVIHIAITISLFYYTVNYMRTDGGINVDSGFWFSLYLASLPLCLINSLKKRSVRSFSQFITDNMVVILPAIVLDMLYFLIGDRGLIIYSTIEIVAIYSFMVKRIRPAYMLIGILIGVVVMYVIRETRNTSSSLGKGDTSTFINDAGGIVESSNAISMFSDLTGIHRELYIGYEYVEQKGLLEPMQIVIVPFYPIPVVPSILSQALFKKTMDEIKPGPVLNEYMAYSGHGHFGIHCVIDVYMRWGVWGVIVFFYLIGYIVASISKNKGNNPLALAFCVMIIASAVGIPRHPLLDIIRTLSYVLILAWLSNLFSPKRA